AVVPAGQPVVDRRYDQQRRRHLRRGIRRGAGRHALDGNGQPLRFGRPTRAAAQSPAEAFLVRSRRGGPAGGPPPAPDAGDGGKGRLEQRRLAEESARVGEVAGKVVLASPLAAGSREARSGPVTHSPDSLKPTMPAAMRPTQKKR